MYRVPPPDNIVSTVSGALVEDLGSGDATAALVPKDSYASASIVAREQGVLAGAPWVDATFSQLDPGAKVLWLYEDGQSVAEGDLLCRIEGNARALLSGERTALNFLQLLSGTATEARRYAEAVEGTGAQVIDTRKTLPGLRLAQKYAVAVGGCGNHRLGLYDAILIKENHIAAAGGIGAALAKASTASVPVEIEVETMGQLMEAIELGVQRVLLDNFNLEQMRRAVEWTNGRACLEASGNVDLQNVRTVAETGVDFISVGALTKHVRALDLSLRFRSATADRSQ